MLFGEYKLHTHYEFLLAAWQWHSFTFSKKTLYICTRKSREPAKRKSINQLIIESTIADFVLEIISVNNEIGFSIRGAILVLKSNTLHVLLQRHILSRPIALAALPVASSSRRPAAAVLVAAARLRPAVVPPASAPHDRDRFLSRQQDRVSIGF